MASKGLQAVAVLLVAVLGVLAAAGEGEHQAATPSAEDCWTLVLGMKDCLSFVTNGSTVTKPEGQCCSGLKSVLRTNAQCLCDAFKNSGNFGVQFNITKALTLPAACHVSAPSTKTCELSLSPAGAPVGAIVSPAGTPSSSIANAPSSTGFGGTELSPSPVQGANGSQMLSLSPGSVVLALAASLIFSSY